MCEACSVFAIHYKYMAEKYKEYRVHRPFIQKAILWSVLWAAFKTSARAKSKICNIYAVQCTLGVAKIFRFTCTLFWSIPTYSITLSRSFSEK